MSKIGDLINEALHAVGLFIQKLLPSSRAALSIATTIVNNIKTFDTAHPEAADTIAKLIPGEIDDWVIKKVREALPTVVVGLSLATAEGNKTPDEIVLDAIKLIKSKAPEYMASHLQDIWVHLSNWLTDNGVTQKDLQRLAQIWYDQTKS